MFKGIFFTGMEHRKSYLKYDHELIFKCSWKSLSFIFQLVFWRMRNQYYLYSFWVNFSFVYVTRIKVLVSNTNVCKIQMPKIPCYLVFASSSHTLFLLNASCIVLGSKFQPLCLYSLYLMSLPFIILFPVLCLC